MNFLNTIRNLHMDTEEEDKRFSTGVMNELQSAGKLLRRLGVSVMLLLHINFVTVCGYRSSLSFQKLQFYRLYLGKDVPRISTK